MSSTYPVPVRPWVSAAVRSGRTSGLAAPMLTGTSWRPTICRILPVLRATWWISTLPATQVTPRRLSSGDVAAMSSATMSSIPVSTSRMSGRGSASGAGASIGCIVAPYAGQGPARPTRLLIGLPKASLMKRAASSTPSRFTPVRTPSRSRR